MARPANHIADVRDLERLAEWFVSAALNVTTCSAEDACQLLLCARDLDVQSHGLQRRLASLLGQSDPPERQRDHIVFSLLRQVVLMRYEVGRDQREAFFRYWLNEGHFRKETLVTIAYTIGLATEQIDCVSVTMRDYVRQWFARHDDIASRRVRAWVPHYLRLSGYRDEALNRARVLLSERMKNGGWEGGIQSTTSALYPLIDSLAMRNTRVIPVLWKDCAIPGLLRGVLYADFRADYERGLRSC